MNARYNRVVSGCTIGLVLGLTCVGGGCDKKYKPLTGPEVDRYLAKQQKQALPVPTLQVSGETVKLEDVMNSPVSQGEILVPLGAFLRPIAQSNGLEQFVQLAQPLVQGHLDGWISNILLYQKAKKETSGDAKKADTKKIDEQLDKNAEKLWREFVVEKHGGNEADADDALQSMGLDRKAYRDFNKRHLLTQYYISTKVPMDRPISHREIVDYYGRLAETQFRIKPRITLRLIDIQPGRMQVKDPTQDRGAAALQLGQQISDRLSRGEEFAKLAAEYSHDPMAAQGGLWKPRDPNSLAAPYDVLALNAQTMTPGQTTSPIEVQDHVFIMRLEDKQEQGSEPLERVQALIEAQIRADRRNEAFREMEIDLAERAKVGDTKAFVDYCVEEIYRQSLAPASPPKARPKGARGSAEQQPTR